MLTLHRGLITGIGGASVVIVAIPGRSELARPVGTDVVHRAIVPFITGAGVVDVTAAFRGLITWIIRAWVPVVAGVGCPRAGASGANLVGRAKSSRIR